MEGSEENSVPKPHTEAILPTSEPPVLAFWKKACFATAKLGLGLGIGFQSSPSIVGPDPNVDPSHPPLSQPVDFDPKSTTDEHHQNQQIVSNEEAINDELQNQQTLIIEELQYQKTISEELENLVLEESEKSREKCAGREEDEAKGKGIDRQFDDGYADNDGNGSENEKEDDCSSENEKENDNGNENEIDGEEAAVGAGLNDGIHKRYQYPVRPDAEDCSYYMRTGSCKYGLNCKFNHPSRRKNQKLKPAKESAKEKEDSTERPSQTECKYHLRFGGCKYGKACRYSHSGGRTPVAPIVEFNFLGLPIRPGEKECPYYMRNGSCKYGSNCRFNHPDPTVGGGDASSEYGNGGSFSPQGASLPTISSWSSPKAVNETVPLVPVMFPPTQALPSPNAEWNGYQVPVYQAPGRRLPTPPAFALNNAVETNFYTHPNLPMLVDEFPERPGRPQCTYFLKTGDCKYRSGCKYHHPKNWFPKTGPLALSDKGLPLRPDQNICSHYNRYGICKFGPACKFDHPASPSVSEPDTHSPFVNSAPEDGASMGSRGEFLNEALIQQPV